MKYSEQSLRGVLALSKAGCGELVCSNTVLHKLEVKKNCSFLKAVQGSEKCKDVEKR